MLSQTGNAIKITKTVFKIRVFLLFEVKTRRHQYVFVSPKLPEEP